MKTEHTIPDALQKFEIEKQRNIQLLGANDALKQLALDFMRETGDYKYTYNFTWLGLPVIQFPQDLQAMQEIIWNVRPEVIIETGIAHGGGLVFYASMLELLGGDRFVVGIDIDIRAHNRARIENHFLARRIRMLEGSSIDDDIAVRASDLARGKTTVVVLDSNHTHEHVLRELQLYSPLVAPGSYLVVFDTTIEDQPDGFFKSRPWNKANNPKTAVQEFLKDNDRFVVDRDIENKLLISVAREGYLRCVRN
jgi:cephalosporin hydroxylase